MRATVLLPAPGPPTSPTFSPRSRLMPTSRTASWPAPYDLRRASASSSHRVRVTAGKYCPAARWGALAGLGARGPGSVGVGAGLGRSLGGAAGDDCHQRGQHHGVGARVDPRE